jgi:hypothetical protein
MDGRATGRDRAEAIGAGVVIPARSEEAVIGPSRPPRRPRGVGPVRDHPAAAGAQA